MQPLPEHGGTGVNLFIYQGSHLEKCNIFKQLEAIKSTFCKATVRSKVADVVESLTACKKLISCHLVIKSPFTPASAAGSTRFVGGAAAQAYLRKI